jgi:anionic cell wall polymer biosynthesis LytR-Cps2A-Psr (LCP) family protein
VQHLDGRTALMYARSRHGRGVFDRAGRQQAVLLGLRDRFLELGLTRALQLLPAVARTVHTDLRTIEMIRLGRRLLGSKREHLHGLVLTPRHAEITVRGAPTDSLRRGGRPSRPSQNGRWVLVPKPDEIHAALADLFSAPLPGHRATETCPDMDAALKRR